MTVNTKRSFKYWLRLILFFIFCIYVTYTIAYSAYLSDLQTRPAHSEVCCQVPADYQLSYENIEVKTRDGLILRGWYIPSRNDSTIITLHGYGGNRLGTLTQAKILAKHGYGVLLYDQRASGESDGNVRSWGWLDVGDVSDAVTYLKTRTEINPEKIGIYGCSTGAEIALASTALEPGLKAVIVEDAEYTSASDLADLQRPDEWLSWPMYPLFIAFMEWRSGASASITLSEAAAQISPRPVLLISSGTTYDYLQAKHYYDLAHQPKEHWNVPEASHCGVYAAHPGEYEQRLVNFFDTAFLGD
jgi:pimeloyl-ACP methyl ester carboxylesterase